MKRDQPGAFESLITYKACLHSGINFMAVTALFRYCLCREVEGKAHSFYNDVFNLEMIHEDVRSVIEPEEGSSLLRMHVRSRIKNQIEFHQLVYLYSLLRQKI